GGIEDGTILFQVGDTVAGALGHECQQPQPGNCLYQRAAGKRHPGDLDTEHYQHQLDNDNTGDEQCHRQVGVIAGTERFHSPWGQQQIKHKAVEVKIVELVNHLVGEDKQQTEDAADQPGQ